jgi:hypothetical protein
LDPDPLQHGIAYKSKKARKIKNEANFLGNSAASNSKMAGFCTIFFLKSFARNGLDLVLLLDSEPEPQ